jgi:hypothetical protein
MASPLDYVMGLGELGATLGTGAVSGAVGAPYGLYKGITSGKYGTQEGVRIAQQEAADFMARNTYQPRGQVAQEALQGLGGLLTESKLPPVLPEAMLLGQIPRQAYAAQAERAGMAAERAIEPVVQRTMAAGGRPAQLMQDLTQGTRRNITPDELAAFRAKQQGLTGNNTFDPRFDDRVLEQDRLKSMTTTVVPVNEYEIPKVSLADYAGRPFITSMSDRSGTGLLTDINGVTLNNAVERQGGQRYMFENPNQVWASGTKPANDIRDLAQIMKQTTGQDPLYVPWVMSPSGGDFANMTGETMLSYAQAAMSPSVKKSLDNKIKKSFIPDWKGLDDPTSIDQFRGLSDTKRKLMKQQLLDKDFRNEGGLSLGEARLAVADKGQLTAKDAQILNIGEIFADQPIIPVSGHRAYPSGVAGQGLGVSDRDLNIFQLLQQHAKNRGIVDPANPSRPDIRTLEMKPYGGLLTDDLLKSLGY